MGLAAQPPTLHSPHTRLLDELNSILPSLPTEAFSLPLINYLLFPVTQILRQANLSALPDNFLEAIYRLLALVIRRWMDVEGGVEARAWEQLWRFVAATAGPRTGGGATEKGKGKAREIGQEAQLQAVELLAALLEEGPGYPTREMKAACASSKAPLMPTLFQTITLLLETSTPSPPHLHLQLASLRLLREIVPTFLRGQHEVLAAVLPGTISAMARLVQQQGKMTKGDVAEAVARVIEVIVVETLNDEDLRSLGVLRPKVNDLSELAEEWETGRSPIPPDGPSPASPTPSRSSTLGGTDAFPPLTATYLDFTSSQLLSSLPPILAVLAAHPSPQSRTAAVTMCALVVSRCHSGLNILVKPFLACLLRLSEDDFEPVAEAARTAVAALVNDDDIEALPTLLDLLNTAINSLPRLIHSQQDDKVTDAAQLIAAIAKITGDLLTVASKPRANPIADMLGPSGNIERWSWGLLGCLELGRPAGWSAGDSSAARAAEKGWTTGLITSTNTYLIEATGTSTESGPSTQFPSLPFRYIESAATTRILLDMLFHLGAAGGESALHSVEFLTLFAKAQAETQAGRASSAILVAERLLDGIAETQLNGPEGKISRMTRNAVKQMVKILVAIDDEDDLDDPTPYEPEPETPESEALLPVERSKGIDALTTLLDRPLRNNTHASHDTRRLHQIAQRSLLTSLSLQSLATCAKILSTSFRPLLLTTLYVVLSHLASPQPLVAEYASTALDQIAYHTGYASVQNLIMDNVDYVINVVSQRLTHARLSSQAPLVLIAMIRLVGAEVVGMVHDVVDEVFDALDDYHGYEVVTSALLAVLVTLVEAMREDVEAMGITEERQAQLDEQRRIDSPPDPEHDFANFLMWYQERSSANQREINSILERAPQHAWGKERNEDVDMEMDGGANPTQDAEVDEYGEPKLTRPQQICKQILGKSIYFLSHRSPFLRAKILGLIAAAVPVLARQNLESTLLPLIDRAWPLSLARLDDPEAAVVTSAAEVIAALSEDVGDFMSKRIVDHAWPTFVKLLKKQRAADEHSALARRGAVGTSSRFTSSHRLYVAILRVCDWVMREVPVEDRLLWDMGLLVRPFLDARAHEELQELAKKVLRDWAQRDEDAVWVLLRSSIGEMPGVWGYLYDSTMDIRKNAEAVLSEV